MFDPRAWAEINLDALRANFRTVRQAADGRPVLAVVKADAYGHGAIECARTLVEEGVWGLAVGDSTEALELRESGIRCPIVILGALAEGELDRVCLHRIGCAVHAESRIDQLADRSRRAGVRLPVHLMVDTGMGRVGSRPDRVMNLTRRVLAHRSLELVGLMTHLPQPLALPRTRGQVAIFREVCRKVSAATGKQPIRHAAASLSIWNVPESRLDMVRPGAALLGIDPGNLTARGARLEPVLSLHSGVVFLKDVPRGGTVGYGDPWRAPHPTRIATVSIGYADGVPVGAAGFPVWIRDRKAPIISRPTMDYLMVDVGQVPGVRVGDRVTLVGGPPEANLTIPELARHAGTIPYQIPCSLGRRVRRIVTSSQLSLVVTPS